MKLPENTLAMARSFNNTKQQTVAIHQPNYLPWPGYFYKIYAADVFIFHDNVEHSKKYPTRRTRIRAREYSDTSNWLTVPLQKHSDFSLIKDLQIEHRQLWQKFHLRKMKDVYGRSPFFGQYFPLIKSALMAAPDHARLADLNIRLILLMSELLGINCVFHRSSELPVSGKKGSAYNVALVKHIGGTAYLSGMGGRNYQGMDEFKAEGIGMEFSGFGDWLLQCPYSQAQGSEYIGGLSVVDALFNIGGKGILELFEKYRNGT